MDFLRLMPANLLAYMWGEKRGRDRDRIWHTLVPLRFTRLQPLPSTDTPLKQPTYQHQQRLLNLLLLTLHCYLFTAVVQEHIKVVQLSHHHKGLCVLEQ